MSRVLTQMLCKSGEDRSQDRREGALSFRILYQDPHWVAIEKPAGFHVHPPEDSTHRIPAGLNCVQVLRKQLNTYLYPVHRLDRATSGVLIFALSSESARSLSQQFRDRSVRKVYYCVVRGWVEDGGVIDSPLRSESVV